MRGRIARSRLCPKSESLRINETQDQQPEAKNAALNSQRDPSPLLWQTSEPIAAESIAAFPMKVGTGKPARSKVVHERQRNCGRRTPNRRNRVNNNKKMEEGRDRSET
jgi:hypothetical protein